MDFYLFSVQGQSDWLIKVDLFLRSGGSVHNRFQIQMEAAWAGIESVSQIEGSDSSQGCGESSEGRFEGDFIAQLLASGRPIFLVRDGRRTQEFSRRELLRQKILSYNRKEKSLEELSRRFIDNFEGRTGLVLQLDKVTLQLRVQRRRIYDIVNIYESLQVVRKAAKNNYVWRGLSQAVATISHLRVAGPDAPLSGKKEKSLENLAARFLRLFLFSEGPLSLEEAARVLIRSEDSALVKTKIRRLYDIVNVFKSLGLVRRVHLPSKKPAFQWQGEKQLMEIIAERANTQNIVPELKQNIPLQENRSDWCTSQAKLCLLEFAFSQRYSQKHFQPSILKQESSPPLSQDTASDICLQY